MVELLVINTSGQTPEEASNKAISLFNQLQGIKAIKQIYQIIVNGTTYVTMYYEYTPQQPVVNKPYISGEPTANRRPPISHDIDKSCITDGFVICNADVLGYKCKACIRGK